MGGEEIVAGNEESMEALRWVQEHSVPFWGEHYSKPWIPAAGIHGEYKAKLKRKSSLVEPQEFQVKTNSLHLSIDDKGDRPLAAKAICQSSSSGKLPVPLIKMHLPS